MEQVAKHDDATILRSVSEVYGEEAGRRRSTGQRHQGYDLVREVAGFKAEVRALSDERAQTTARRKHSGRSNTFLLNARFWSSEELQYEVPRWEFAKGNSTLAVEKGPDLVRYIVSLAIPLSPALNKQPSKAMNTRFLLIDFLSRSGRATRVTG